MQYAIVRTTEKTSECFNDNGSSDCRIKTEVKVMPLEAAYEAEADLSEGCTLTILAEVDTQDLMSLRDSIEAALRDEAEAAYTEPDDTPYVQEEPIEDSMYPED